MLATLPLDQLPLVALDLETTGLNPARDRIIQLGLCCLPADEAAPDWQQLVNPGIAIPPQNTKIHGIDDAMVTSAVAVGSIFPQLRQRVSGRVILGYNIGFDLAVLEAESQRHGVEWAWQHALCLRQLARLVFGPEKMLIMGDLDALARHYGVSTEARHSALGDARMTAAIFQAMLADLSAVGISNFAAARAAVARLEDDRRNMVVAGWVDVAAASPADMTGVLLQQIDPWPYQHRIVEIMQGPPQLLDGDTSIREAAMLMRDEGMECVFVRLGAATDSTGKSADTRQLDSLGIVSERDIVLAMATPLEALETVRSMPLSELASAPLVYVRTDDFLHTALGRLRRHDIRHLAVADAEGQLVGWVSARALLQQRISAASDLAAGIEAATTAEAMAGAFRQLPAMAAALHREGLAGQLISAVISSDLRAMLARACTLGLAAMEAAGEGPPPTGFALLMLGSAGRGESLLAADQDHAIVFADTDDPLLETSHQQWFCRLGGHIADILHAAGVPYCQGGVMSGNPDWCKSLGSWQKTIRGWVSNARPGDILQVDIFFDFCVVHGDAGLGRQLEKALRHRRTAAADFLKALAASIINLPRSVTLFGRLRPRLDIKQQMLLPLVEMLRVLAISRGVSARPSRARAECLAARDDMPPEILQLADDLDFAYQCLLRQQLADIANGKPPGRIVEVAGLHRDDQRRLVRISGRIDRLDSLLRDCLF